jgi:hypothetical protein
MLNYGKLVPKIISKIPGLVYNLIKFGHNYYVYISTALKLAGKKYHGEGKIGENHNIWGKIA